MPLSETPSRGLTEQEARRRADSGLANTIRETTSRSVPNILKANLLAPFNALLGSLFVAILVVGPIQDAVFEGRRVIGNVERLASLFFTKTVYAFLLAVSVSVAVVPFPFLPRQLTLISAFTIGIPSVFLALAPSFERSPGNFLGRVMRFAVPAGLVAGAATFAAYALTVNEPNISVSEERTVATIVIAAIGLWTLARLARPLTARRRALLVAMTGGLLIAFLLPSLRALLDLDLPRPLVALAAVGVVALAFLGLEVGDRAAMWIGGWALRLGGVGRQIERLRRR